MSAFVADAVIGDLIKTINNLTPVTNDWFGYSIASTPNGNLLIGVLFDDTGAGNAGSAYLFNGTIEKTLTTLFGKGKDSYEIKVDKDLVYAFVDNKNVSSSLSSGWNHITVTFSGERTDLYVNGVSKGTFNSNITSNSNPISVGKDSNLTIDEIYFYSRALSVEEVSQRFQRG